MPARFKACPRCGGAGKLSNPIFVGQNMRRLREQHELSMRSVAAEMGISFAYLSDLECGKRNWLPQLETSFVEQVHKLSQKEK